MYCFRKAIEEKSCIQTNQQPYRKGYEFSQPDPGTGPRRTTKIIRLKGTASFATFISSSHLLLIHTGAHEVGAIDQGEQEIRAAPTSGGSTEHESRRQTGARSEYPQDGAEGD